MRGLKTLGLLLLLAAGCFGQGPTLKTITLDGDPADWAEVLANPLQVTADADGSSMFATQCATLSTDRDCPVGSNGRDLNTFAWTFDNTNIYLYQTRYGNSSNVQDFWFYIDVGQDQTLGNTDLLLRVKFKGSNRNTEIVLYQYRQDGTDPDPMVDAAGFADGYTVIGMTGAQLSYQNAYYGFVDGTGFEAAIAWSVLGVPVGTGIYFHVASSNGSNIPTQVDDNCGGPDGRLGSFGFYLVDIAPDRSASTQAGGTMAYAHTVTNAGTFTANMDFQAFSDRGFSVTLYSVSDDEVMAIDADGDGSFTGPSDFLNPTWDRNSDDLPDTGDLAPSETFSLEVRIAVPSGLPSGTDTAMIVASVIGQSAEDTAIDTTYIGDIQLDSDQMRTGVPGGVSRFPLSLLHYLVPDTIRLLAVSAQGWGLAFYTDPEGDGIPNDWMGTDVNGDGDFSDPGDSVAPAYDSDGDGFPDTGPLGSGTPFLFVVECAIPTEVLLGTLDTITAYAVTSTLNGAVADTALGTLEVRPRLSIAPEYTVAAQTNLFVAAGFTVLFPHVVVNSSDGPDRADLTASVDQGAIALFWSDPNCNGDIADGVIITQTDLLPEFGGRQCVILVVAVPDTVLKGCTVQALPVARSQADPTAESTATDEAKVSQIVPYQNALYTQQATRFAHCQTVYPRGYYFMPSYIYYLRYDDPTADRIRDAVFVANGIGQFSDAYTFGVVDEPGVWSVHADGGDEFAPFDEIGVILEPQGNVNTLDPFGPDRQRYDPTDNVGVACLANNTNLGGRYDASIVRTVLVDAAQTVYWNGSAFVAYTGTEWSRTLPPRTVEAQSGEAFPHTLTGVTFPWNGVWTIKAVWEGSCGYLIAAAEAAYLVGSTLSGYEDASFSVPASEFNLHDPVYLAGHYYYPSTALVMAFYDALGNLIAMVPAPTDGSGAMALEVDTSSWEVEGVVHTMVYPSGYGPPPVYNAADSMSLGTTDFTLIRLPGLLRNDQYPVLGAAIFKQAYPLDPALDPVTDLEKADFRSMDVFPHEESDLNPGSSAMIFYELSQAGNTLRLQKQGGKIVITF